MAKIILIETSTVLCSAALSIDGKVVSYVENNERRHASMATPFVKEVLDSQGLNVKDCDAVCVSMGPGSYTGLRVGVSTAKGLCFGAGLPLIAVGSLDTLAQQAITEGLVPDGCKHIVPMIDARRMEVYCSVSTPEGKQLTETEAKIIDENSFANLLEEGNVLFIGDGAGKCADVIKNPNAAFIQCNPKASSMALVAEAAYKEKRFKDVAYFEPFYLKDFVATTSKKKLF